MFCAIDLDAFEQQVVPFLVENKDILRRTLGMTAHAGALTDTRKAVSFLHGWCEITTGVQVTWKSKQVRKGKTRVREPGPIVMGSAWWQSFFNDVRKRYLDDLAKTAPMTAETVDFAFWRERCERLGVEEAESEAPKVEDDEL